MTTRQTSLHQYYPYFVFAGGVLIISYSTYCLLCPNRGKKRLRRSNARRVPRRRRSQGISASDTGGVLTSEQLQEVLDGERAERIDIPESVAEALVETGHAAQEARGAGHADGRRNGITDVDSEFSFTAETKENMENENLLMLLYRIAQDQAQRDSYVHRGVTCNNCNAVPIRGVRYRCANCLDYDLCEQCEALDSAHPRTHLFYKVRIPAPFLGNPRHAQTPWYPGKPQIMPISLGPETLKHLAEVTKFDPSELEALYEQFKCLAASEYDDKRFSINAAISRETFDSCFIPSPHHQPPPPNLIYDRVFAFYDTNADGLIDFEEFVVGLAATPSNNKSKMPERLKRIFRGYDLDNDGYVDRNDFLRMFKAFYALSKDLVKDIIASMGDELYDPVHMDGVLQGRQPVSAAFTSSIPSSSRSLSKPPPTDPDDETEDPDTNAILPSGSDMAEPRDPEFRHSEMQRERDVSGGLLSSSTGIGIGRAHGEDTFMIKDEEDELDLPAEERDVGNEVLYQMTLQGINELLDLLFKAKERDSSSSTADANEGITARDTETVQVDPANISPESTLELVRQSPETMSSQQSSNSNTVPLTSTAHVSLPSRLDGKLEKKPKDAYQNEKERNNKGRLSYKEFERIMTGKDAVRLKFLSSWIEIASF